MLVFPFQLHPVRSRAIIYLRARLNYGERFTRLARQLWQKEESDVQQHVAFICFVPNTSWWTQNKTLSRTVIFLRVEGIENKCEFSGPNESMSG